MSFDRAKEITVAELCPVAELKGVACLESWDDKILVGHTDGSLTILTDAPAPGSPSLDPSWRTLQTKPSFATASVLKLVLAKASNMLLALTASDGINAYSIPALNLKAQASRTYGASTFAWSDDHQILVSAAKRRLTLFSYDGLEFVYIKEAAVSHTIKSITICGKLAYLTLSTGWAIVDITTAAVITSSNVPAACTFTTTKRDVYMTTSDGKSTAIDEKGRPKLSSLAPILSWDSSTTTTTAAIPMITAVISMPPYICAITKTGLQIQPCEGYTEAHTLQHLPFNDMTTTLPLTTWTCRSLDATTMTTSSIVLCHGERLIHQIKPVPIAQQAEAFIDIEEYDQALALCSTMPAGKLRASLEDRAHLLLGRALLAQQNEESNDGGKILEAAMLHLGSSKLATPLEMLLPLPGLAPPKLLYRLGYIETEDEGSIGSRSATPSPVKPTRKPGGGPTAAGKAPLSPTDSSKSSPNKDIVNGERGRKQQLKQESLSTPASISKIDVGSSGSTTNENIGKVAAVMLPYLLTFRNRTATSESDAVLIDTAVLNALLALPDNGSLLRFLQRPQNVDEACGEEALRKAGRYAELVEFYKSKGRVSAALNLLHTLSCEPLSLKPAPQGPAGEMAGTTGVWAAVRLLTSLDTYDVDLVNEHADWILRGDQDAALEMFTHLKPPLPIPSVLQILKSHAPQLAAPYLEGVRGAPPTAPALAGFERYDQDLAYVYLNSLKDSRDPAYNQALTSLKSLILASESLDALELMHRLQSTPAFLEVRALLLGYLGRHTEALRILVHRLKDVRAAEAYCARIQEKAAQGSSLADPDIFLLLTKVLLEEENASGGYRAVQRPPEDRRWKEIAEILSRRRDAVHPLQALSILPNQLPLAWCLGFVEGALWGANEEKRRVGISSNLRQAEYFAALGKLAEEKQRCFLVTPEKACCICHKRLGAAALAAFPAGTLAHFSCYKRSTGGGSMKSLT